MDSFEADSDIGEHDEGFAHMRGDFVIFGESALDTKPSKGSLDDPSFWQNIETRLGIAATNNLQKPPVVQKGKIMQPLIASIGQNGVQSGK